MQTNGVQATDAIPNVPLLDVSRSNQEIREEVLQALAEVYDSGRFLFGPAVQELEAEVARISNTRFGVGCASGSDALLLSLMALGVTAGDEVIVPSFTFFATASCVSRLGATPVFADIDPRTYNIDPNDIAAKITGRTRAIIPVHLFGQAAPMDVICKLAAEHEIPVVEDAAQAIGAAYYGRPVGSWGQVGCISFYPTKNLGGMGDGGMLTTNCDILADRLRLLAGHGMRPRYYHSEIGINSRLDTYQAAGLMVKIKRLQGYTLARQKNAQNYIQLFRDRGLAVSEMVEMPYVDSSAHHVWNQFSLRVRDGHRDGMRQYLTQQGVGTEVYYPVPLHLQECFQDLGYSTGYLPHTERAAKEILHLPIFPELTFDEQARVVDCVAAYCSQAVRAAA
ncbi:MAG: DegT/DnrJ/EryC1/StrS family aminotransferase [bacterium]|nr:DegT/DnrJ/EryC1/StrS family aminotransferase [bacterium]